MTPVDTSKVTDVPLDDPIKVNRHITKSIFNDLMTRILTKHSRTIGCSYGLQDVNRAPPCKKTIVLTEKRSPTRHHYSRFGTIIGIESTAGLSTSFGPCTEKKCSSEKLTCFQALVHTIILKRFRYYLSSFSCTNSL